MGEEKRRESVRVADLILEKTMFLKKNQLHDTDDGTAAEEHSRN